MQYSYSKITDAYKCLRLFKLKHIDGIQEDIRSADMEFGTVKHSVFENIFKPDDVLGEVDPVDDFKNRWSKAKLKKLEYGRFDHAQLEKIGEKLIERFVKTHKKHFKPYKVEELLLHKFDDIEFKGKPDFVGWYKDIPCVVDFKTAQRAYDKKRIQVDEQMFLYAKLVKLLFDFDVKQIVYVVFCKAEERIQVITLDIDDNHINKMVDNVIKMAQDLKTRTYFPMNRTHCEKCPMFERCYK